MPRYLIERSPSEHLGERLGSEGRGLVLRANLLAEVTWLHSYISVDGRSMTCLYEAANPEALHHAGVLAQLPIDSITEVLVVEPFAFTSHRQPR